MLVPAIAFSWWLVSVPMGKAVLPEQPPAIAALQPVQAGAALRSAVAPEGARVSTNTESQALAPKDDETVDLPTERVLYRGLITPAIAHQARQFLDLPMGAERTADVDGHHFVFVLERHYHPPGFVGAPNGWHKGVTVYELR
jgi:hypothetical protein